MYGFVVAFDWLLMQTLAIANVLCVLCKACYSVVPAGNSQNTEVS